MKKKDFKHYLYSNTKKGWKKNTKTSGAMGWMNHLESISCANSAVGKKKSITSVIDESIKPRGKKCVYGKRTLKLLL